MIRSRLRDPPLPLTTRSQRSATASIASAAWIEMVLGRNVRDILVAERGVRRSAGCRACCTAGCQPAWDWCGGTRVLITTTVALSRARRLAVGETADKAVCDTGQL